MIETPRGFRFSGVYSGVKRNTSKLDLALCVSDRPAVAAGVYTTNRVFAAPVAYNRARTPAASMRGVVINSGNANACTGERGLADAERTAALAAEACGAKPDEFLVLSTGIIGAFLPMEKIESGIRLAAAALGDGEQHLVDAARGMLTTDTVHKLAARTIRLGARSVRIVGMAKGAAMIGPNMATMLGIVVTDAPLAADEAQKLLSVTADRSFNCISVDGHMSTNDTVLLLANGAAGGTALAGEELAAFGEALCETCIELACAIASDGEGATHLITLDITGCASASAARQIARTVADSPLVKTAIAGADPNWGRIVSAAGYAEVPFDPAGVELSLNGFLLYRRGAPVEFDAAAVSESIRASRDTSIVMAFSEGTSAVRFWTTDLTAEYVRLNADYHMKRTPLERVRLGAVFLALVIVLSVVGYLLLGWRFLDALYMVVITVATVGFGERSRLSPAEQALTIAVIVLGMTAAVFTMGGFFQMMTQGEVERAMSTNRNARAIDRLVQHVLVCGFGRVGQILCRELHARGEAFVVIDRESRAAEDAQALGYLALHGDATEEEMLAAAGIGRAKSVVTVLPDDSANVFITLTSRNLNPKLQIISRGEQHSTQKKLMQAGANRVVLPASIGAMRIAAMITHPSTVELMELVAGRNVLDVEVAELTVHSNSSLAGRAIGEVEKHGPQGLLIVALKQATGDMQFNPERATKLAIGDVAIVMGRTVDIERFRKEYQL